MTRFSHQTLSELSKSVTRYVKQHSIPENAAQGQRPGIDSVGGGITKLVPIGGKEIQYHIIVDFLFPQTSAVFVRGCFDALCLQIVCPRLISYHRTCSFNVPGIERHFDAAVYTA